MRTTDLKLKKGIFCISIDTELLWGRHDLHYEDFIESAKKERVIITQLLSLFKKYNIPVTWAIVGHLFLDKCQTEKGVKHPEAKRPKYIWLKKDWFSADPCSSLKQNNLWYGTDIIKQIQKVKNQEVASHSFSHLIFGDQGCTIEAADSDLALCIKSARLKKITLSSFVYPRNSIGYTNLLEKYNFRSYRGQDQYLVQFSPFWIAFLINKLVMFIDMILVRPHAYLPKKENNLINIPGSLYYMSARGIRKYIPVSLRVIKAKKSIDMAIKEKKIVHIWFHPIDLAINTTQLMQGFEKILKYAVEKQNQGNIEIKTMKQIASSF